MRGLPPLTAWTRVLVALVAAHLALGLARVPTKVWAKRLGEIAEYRARGPVRYHLDNAHHQGAGAVEWLLDHTPEDAVVLWRGQWKGAFEFASALLAPRLLVHESFAPRADEPAPGLPAPARGPLPDGRTGTFVLVATGDHVELVVQ